MIRKIFENFVSIILNRNFKLDDKVPFGYIVSLTISKALSALRGLVKLRELVFVGENVKIRCKSSITFGTKSSLGDNLIIDGLSKDGIVFEQFSKIGSNSYIIASGSIRDIGKGIYIGRNVAIGEFSYIGGAGGVVIGQDTIAGQYLSIHPENHSFDNENLLIREQGVTRKGVYIGKNCWIGAKVTFCDGAIIGDRCVVAAGSVVTSVFEDNVLIGGIPARVLKRI